MPFSGTHLASFRGDFHASLHFFGIGRAESALLAALIRFDCYHSASNQFCIAKFSLGIARFSLCIARFSLAAALHARRASEEVRV